MHAERESQNYDEVVGVDQNASVVVFKKDCINPGMDTENSRSYGTSLLNCCTSNVTVQILPKFSFLPTILSVGNS